MDFTKTIINAIKIWVNKQLSFIENKISDLEDRPSAFIQSEEPNEAPDGTLWIDTDEESIPGVGSNTAESLTFTGAVEATYNGLSPVTVNIPKVTVNGVTSDENGNIEIEVGSEQIQTDWNQNDSTQPDYIKNRTHWVEGSTYHTLDDNFIPETIARTSAVEEIKTLVGETSVSEQIEAAIAEIPEVEIPEQVQSDWNQNDSTAADYIKNRTHYSEQAYVDIFSVNLLESELTEATAGYGKLYDIEFDITAGETYKVIYDSNEYFVPALANSSNGALLGELGGNKPDFTNYPFLIATVPSVGKSSVIFETKSDHTIAIQKLGERVTKLDKKFIPTPEVLKSEKSVGISIPLPYRVDCLVYGNNVLIGCTNNEMVYSHDGFIWHEVDAPPTEMDFSSLVFFKDRFFAYDYKLTKVYYSDNGINWTQQTIRDSTGTTGMYNVAHNNEILVAVNKWGSNHAYSTDGINWTFGDQSWRSGFTYGNVSYVNDRFFATSTSEDMSSTAFYDTYYSLDGINWEPGIDYNLTCNGLWLMPVYTGEKYITASDGFWNTGDGTHYGAISADGTSWEAITLPVDNHWEGIAYNNGIVLILGDNNDSTDYMTTVVYSSDHGVTWNTTTFKLDGVANDRKLFVAYDKFIVYGYGGGTAAYSEDGVNWSTTTMPYAGFWDTPVFAFDKTFLPNALHPMITWTTDGINWRNDYDDIVEVTNEKLLPLVTTADDGKILRVSGGVWKAAAGTAVSQEGTATVGQVLKVAAVDESGKVTAVSTEDMEVLPDAEEEAF